MGTEPDTELDLGLPPRIPGVPDETETADPRLLEILKTAGDEWGALGVALAAAAFTDPEVLISRVREIAGAPQEDAEPLPDGEYARVEILGHDSHTGWVTDSTRAGVPVMVVRDWDGRVIAEVPGGSLYRFVPLATPLKRPVTRAMLPSGRGGFDPEYEIGDDPYDDADGPF
jgi:hypothetical protein